MIEEVYFHTLQLGDKIFVAGNVHTVWGKAQYVNQQDYDGYLIYGKEEEVWFQKDLDKDVKNIPE